MGVVIILDDLKATMECEKSGNVVECEKCALCANVLAPRLPAFDYRTLDHQDEVKDMNAAIVHVLFLASSLIDM